MARLTLEPKAVLTARGDRPRSLKSLEKDCVRARRGRSSAITTQLPRTQIQTPRLETHRKGYHTFNSKISSTCIDDSGPRLDVDAGSSLPGPEDPHERLSAEHKWLCTPPHPTEEREEHIQDMVWVGLSPPLQSIRQELVLSDNRSTLIRSHIMQTGCLSIRLCYTWEHHSEQYLSDQVLVLHHAQLSAGCLGDPLPCHQVTDQHGSRADQDVAGVQVSLQEVLLGFTDVDASEGRLWEGVGRDERQAVQAHLDSTHPLEAVFLTSVRPLLCHNHYPLIIEHVLTGSTASAVATRSSALWRRPLTISSPSNFPTTNTRLPCGANGFTQQRTFSVK
ncbi:hypothetical protein F7725_000644 [Dissostichus mawsoni]|uniref:Uncharacterized protein n=1 Tax=Dissostichus mawsoni TaxID=36200 RepID=A0A7J5ZHD4_DISMA|nr:hypothetical protein F7725_000644 [Dissostichus mawsoni]